MRLRHPQQFRLPARYLTVELRVSEQRRAGAVLAHLRRLALRLQPVVAHEAMAARDVEWDHHAIADREVGDLAAHGLDDAHRLVPEHIALVDVRTEHLVEVKIGPADPRRRDADDRVSGMLDGGVGHRVDADVPPPLAPGTAVTEPTPIAAVAPRSIRFGLGSSES
jgi:hypothetical protein